ncbi:patatin-like phospholipase family protein [uncultured Oxalicibacterium sp.]|uniref:patatin-like phospholipase family protein n=1 Tax=uncultured Oxalicibacterium sp. TaxID=1168540 RepID=UPI0025ECBD06|nr:patatin-like phospholipase family protein [uncultured Oxalicibacterium sp.]
MQSLSRFWHALFIACIGLAVSGCSLVHYRVNDPLPLQQTDRGYSVASANLDPGEGRIFMVMMFSGGGARSAALGYGVLEEFARNRFVNNGKAMRLFDEVDLVYGVSGGSILAAYYGLHGDDVLKDFDSRFLSMDFEDKIVSRVISLSNQWRLTSPRFGRSDLLEEQLDEALFDKATFGDMARQRKGPLVIISATDMSTGSRFDFMQETFNLICSDLSTFPIARAVAASSAVPLVFSPVTLWNYAGTCGYQLPEPVQKAIASTPRTRMEAASRLRSLEMQSYLDRDKRPYIHLLDGGLSDNLSIRGLLDMEAVMGSDEVRRDFRLDEANKFVLVVVNAQNDPDHSIDHSADVPGFREVVRAISDIPIARYTQESERVMQSAFERWRDMAKVDADKEGRAPLHMYYINVTLKNLADEVYRNALLNVPTSLYLPRKTVLELRQAATQLLQDSPDFQRLLKDLAAQRSNTTTAQ